MIKVLVIGSKGQLGRTLKEHYTSFKEAEFIFTTKSILDITNKTQVVNYFSNNQIDYCINCAAYTNVEKAEEEPEAAFLVNAEGVKYLAASCKNNNVILVHISTDYVFDGNKITPYQEKDETNPINQYGKSKLLGEKYIETLLEKYFIIRTSWLYSKYGHNFIKTISSKLKESHVLRIVASQKGTPTSCEDLGLFIIYLIENNINEFGVYHFSAKGEATWYDFAIEIAKELNFNTQLIKPIKSFKTTAKRPLNSVLDNTKSKKVYNKSIFWKESVKKILQKL